MRILLMELWHTQKIKTQFNNINQYDPIGFFYYCPNHLCSLCFWRGRRNFLFLRNSSELIVEYWHYFLFLCLICSGYSGFTLLGIVFNSVSSLDFGRKMKSIHYLSQSVFTTIIPTINMGTGRMKEVLQPALIIQ